MNRRITKVVGCGGVGKGLLFHSPQMETLGRSESRLVTLSDAKDYCKQQIVFYYIAMLLRGRASVYPIGAVGKDGFGSELIEQMKGQGMDVSCMEKSRLLPTMLSICLQYPDKEGCNFTAGNSAAGEVTPDFIRKALEKIGIDEETCLVAVPEIRIDSRVEMMRMGKEKGAFCAISIPAGEARQFEEANIYPYCDLVSVNEEEAQAMTGTEKQGRELARETLSYLQRWQPGIALCVTLGKEGACCARGDCLEWVPAFPAKTVNTTGAGDAFLGAMVGGMALGLPFFKGREERCFGDGILTTAPELAAFCAGLAVESPDSIPEEITKELILSEVEKRGWEQKFFEV